VSIKAWDRAIHSFELIKICTLPFSLFVAYPANGVEKLNELE